FFQAEDGIRDWSVTGVQTCALPISHGRQMNFTDLFIRRPVLAIVVNLLIVIAGVQAIRSLNVRQYPRSENAAVTVTTSYVGASRSEERRVGEEGRRGGGAAP